MIPHMTAFRTVLIWGHHPTSKMLFLRKIVQKKVLGQNTYNIILKPPVNRNNLSIEDSIYLIRHNHKNYMFFIPEYGDRFSSCRTLTGTGIGIVGLDKLISGYIAVHDQRCPSIGRTERMPSQ